MADGLRILMLVHGFNSLAQRLHVDLREAGHAVTVEFDVSDPTTEEAVALADPDVILAPFLKRMIPARVWQNHLCLVLHPGPPGDAGPAALDWAILDGHSHWGVTLLEANGDFDAGPVWASRSFPMRETTKSDIYRTEVTEAAVACVFEALEQLHGGRRFQMRHQTKHEVRFRAAPTRTDRAIDWRRDTTEDVLRKVRASDGMPGAPATLDGRTVRLHDARPAPELFGRPGDVIAQCGPAVAIGTRDGAVWIGRLRDPNNQSGIKLPAAQALDGDAMKPASGYNELSYREDGDVGFLRFAFLNGAMGTDACQRLLAAYQDALARPTRVLVLEGGTDAWSNGMDLNLIEATDNPAEASWENINAIDDLAEAILRTDDKLTIAAVGANAGAGGVFLAGTCDELWLRQGVILNPHYKDMGNLFGSEFWTYSLQRCTDAETARQIVERRLPMGAKEAHALGLANRIFVGNRADFDQQTTFAAKQMAGPSAQEALEAKRNARQIDEKDKPLSAYRDEELAQMRRAFFGFDPSYHIARSNFVRKVPKARTPRSLAHHRDATSGWQSGVSMRRAS